MLFKPNAVFMIFILALAIGAGGSYSVQRYRNSFHEADRSMGGIKSYFSPKGGCTDAIVAQIVSAKKSILLQAYSFTSDPIETALIDAHRRGVEVHVILDRSQYDAKGAAALPLYDAGIDVRMDSKHQISHNKVIVIDSMTLITGSFNFTRQAEIGNAENLLIINSFDLAGQYTANWQHHFEHSEPFSIQKVLK